MSQPSPPTGQPLSSKPEPSKDREPSGIAADDAGATSMAERVARDADEDRVSQNDRKALGAPARRDADA
jgi:hypothetical protein